VTIAFAAAIYLVIWWVVLFAVLPFGVRTSDEAGESVSPGNAESAPHRPLLLRKVLATTVIATLVFSFVYALIVHHIVSLDDIPFFPRYESLQ
jgi:predicted secreted protein